MDGRLLVSTLLSRIDEGLLLIVLPFLVARTFLVYSSVLLSQEQLLPSKSMLINVIFINILTHHPQTWMAQLLLALDGAISA